MIQQNANQANAKTVANAKLNNFVKDILHNRKMAMQRTRPNIPQDAFEANTESTKTVTNNLKKYIMTNNQSTTAEVKIVANTNIESVNGVNNVSEQVCNIEDITPIKVKKIYSLKTLEHSGIVIAFAAANRKVYSAQLKKLFREVSNKDEHVFRNHIILCSLKEVIEKRPNFKAYDLDGHLLTTHTSGIERYYLVLDGQHRIVCCKQHPEYELDCFVEIAEGCTDPISYIKDLNTMNKNWCGDDLKHSMVENGNTKNELYTQAEQLAKKYSLTQKTAEGWLTFKRDATRMSDLRNGRDTTLYNEENGQRGKIICAAVQKMFKNDKVGRKLQMLDAIVEAYQSISDRQHATFTRRMIAFLLSLTENEIDFLHKNLNDCNYGQVTDFIVEHFKGFQDDADKGRMETLINEKEEELSLFMNREPDKIETVKRLKFGTPAQILQNDIEMRNIMNAKQRKAIIGSSFATPEENGEVETSEDDIKDNVEVTATITDDVTTSKLQPAAILVYNTTDEIE